MNHARSQHAKTPKGAKEALVGSKNDKMGQHHLFARPSSQNQKEDINPAAAPATNIEDDAISQSTRKSNESENAALKIENGRLEHQIKVLKQKVKGQDDADAKLKVLQQKLKAMEEKYQKEFLEKQNLLGEVTGLKCDIEFMKDTAETLESTIDSLNETIGEKDVEIRKGEDKRAKMMAEMQEANGDADNQDEEIFELKRDLNLTTLELEHTAQQLDESERELQEKRERNAYLEKQNADLIKCYIGHRGDTIDETLANYIQQYPEKEKMRIVFIRESEGVYKFGQKRVCIKIEHGQRQGRALKVRVGGGFMHIDEFIEQYTDSEIAKLERRDSLTRFQNKLQLQRISVDQSNEALEQSPIKVPQDSHTNDFLKSAMQTSTDNFNPALSARMGTAEQPIKAGSQKKLRQMTRNSVTKKQQKKLNPLQQQKNPVIDHKLITKDKS